MKENKRKCFKCGNSPFKDPDVKLHRFPKPGTTNSLRCETWAKYCFPQGAWASPEFQYGLYAKHFMLCSKHFMKSSFIDNLGKRLFKFAVPDEECDKIALEASTLDQSNIQPTAGPSRTMQPLCEHVNSANCTVGSIPRINTSDKSTSHLVSKRPMHSEQEKHLLQKMKNHMRKINRLQKTVKHLKNESFLKVLSKNDSVNEVLKYKISPAFALLVQNQMQNYKRKAKGRRYDLESKIIALRLYKRSPRCYKLLRRMICLPTPSSLKSLLNKFNLSVGINAQIFNVLKKTLNSQARSDNEYVLMFDEMAIKKNLFYNRKADFIEGYQDHALHGRSPQIATHALVFMIGAIRKKLKQPIAYYFSGGSVTADRLSVLIKEVLCYCINARINISAMVCDLDGVNKRAVSILGASVKHPYITINNQEVVTLFDTPHLLKCFRNMFLKYDIKCPTNITSDNNIGVGVAKWSHIKDFYAIDNQNPNFVFAPCLKQEHLNPNTKQKMKVKLAAQVLSKSVAAGMYAKISQGDLPSEAITTANVIANMDNLFDCVNACTADLRRGKIFSTNIKSNSPHFGHFTKMKSFFKELTFLGCKRVPPSQEGWIWSINAIEKLWRNLSNKHKCIKSLETRRLQQDALENLFGCIRSNCGCNTNPTAGQFVAGLKTAILSSLTYVNTGNCENDENEVILSNFKVLLSPTTEIRTVYDDAIMENIDYSIFSSFESSLEENSGEMQACAYVCGFILKKNGSKCKYCKKIFLSHAQDILHIFVDFKEYNDVRKSLVYASKNLVKCVESTATIINSFLEKEGWKVHLKDSLEILIKSSVNFDFLNNCAEHKSSNLNYIFNNVFYICVKRFCILKNRQFAEQYSANALKQKIDILRNK